MHENAGNIGMRMDFIASIHSYLTANVVIVGYRGYGHSTCNPSEQGLMIDSLRILEYTFDNKKINKNKVYLLGSSLGGATAIYAAQSYQNRLKGLILVNTFTSLGEVVDDMNFIFWAFRRLILSKSCLHFLRTLMYILDNNWPNEERIKDLKLPILFVSGEEDELIPPEQMDRLFKAAVNAKFKKMYKVKDGEHNDTW